MFTCVCGGLGVMREGDVVCQACGLVLVKLKVATDGTSIPYPDPGEMWARIRERIHNEARSDANFLKALGIAPLE